MKKILVILDGAGDLPHPNLGGKTPLEVAHMPNLDIFVKNGKMGFMYPINEDTVPGSDNSLLSIFGNDPQLCKRGVYEAIGSGIDLKKGDLALRTNFGTIENLKNRKVIDRRAGRTLTTEEAFILAKDLNEKIKLSCEFEFKNTVQHRGVLVLRGKFSDKISNVDPEWSNTNRSFEFDFSRSLEDDELSKESSRIANEFITQAFTILNNHPINMERKRKGLLPANMIFLRGGGVEVPKIKKYKDWMSINMMPLEIGISSASGMQVFSKEYPKLKSIDSYRNLYDGLYDLIDFSKKTIKKRGTSFSGCYIQFKETDVPGHDNKPLDKKRMLEIIDKEFFSFLRKYVKAKDIKLVVTCDHSTPCKLKAHSSDPVPVLVSDSKGYDGGTHFCENEARRGSIGKIYGKEFIEKTGLGD
jgi:2,3-bisphosphoglycerate-independent phosphoglycerate mutase